MEVHRLLTKERVLGLNLLMGIKSGPPQNGAAEKGMGLNGDLQAVGLPLFGAEVGEEA